MSEREKKAKLNISISLLSQIITLLCGLVVPGLMISSFGSEAYGATTSITQFLAYIALLEGGIGGVARAALYKPLADKNYYDVSAVVYEIRKFFRIIAFVFVAYVAILAVSYKAISNLQSLDWLSTAVLVVVISISTFAQYFIGISYSVLLQADQKTYITQAISLITTVLNTVFIVILVKAHFGLIMVKLVSSIVFTFRPILMWIYVRKHYNLVGITKSKCNYLRQKWDALAQHISYFLHSNTDVVVLTVFSNLSLVSVYSVYNMVISNMQNLVTSFSAGMEALFGELYAKGEYKELNKLFSYYETMLSSVSLFFYSVTAVMIVPFVKIYTKEISDANYIVPLFSFLLVISSLLFCLRFPYHSMIIAAGKFKETRWAAFGEAFINITLSVVLVKKYGLTGVAVGTAAAILFRFIYYVYYLAKNVIYRNFLLFIKRIAVDSMIFVIVYLLGSFICAQIEIISFMRWIYAASLISVLAVSVVTLCTLIIYREDSMKIKQVITNKLGR